MLFRLLASVPSLAVDTRMISPVNVSLTNMSRVPFVSPETRLSASLSNATYRPSAEIEGEELIPSPKVPSLVVDTAVISPVLRVEHENVREIVCVTCNKIVGFTCEGDVPARQQRLGWRAYPMARCSQLGTRIISPVSVSLTKTSSALLPSPSTRLLAALVNAT